MVEKLLHRRVERMFEQQREASIARNFQYINEFCHLLQMCVTIVVEVRVQRNATGLFMASGTGISSMNKKKNSVNREDGVVIISITRTNIC